MFEALLILAAATAPQTADPLAEARAGKVQCVTPNRTSKTCTAIVSYKPTGGDTFDTTGTAMYAPSPLITLVVTSSGTVENGMLCSVISKAEYAAGKVMMDGAPANDAMAKALLAQIGSAIQPIDGKKLCGNVVPDGDVLLAKAIIDGQPMPALDQRFIWVDPSEYKVGP